MPTTSFTMRMDTKLKQSLEEIAKQEDRSVAYIANRAIERMIEQREQTDALIEAARANIAAGEIGASFSDVDTWLKDLENGTEAPFPSGKSQG